MKNDLLITAECEKRCYDYFHLDKEFVIRIIQLDLDLYSITFNQVLSTTAEAEYGKLKKRVKNREQRFNFLRKRLRRDRWYTNRLITKYVEDRLNEPHVRIQRTILERLEAGDSAAQAVDYVRQEQNSRLNAHSLNLFGESL